MGTGGFGYRGPLEFVDFVNFVWLLFATRSTSKMKNLAFLMSARRLFVAWDFRLNAGYQRRYGNRILAMKTKDATIRLLQFFLSHA